VSRLLLTLVLSLTLAAAGCGGSDGGESTPEASPAASSPPPTEIETNTAPEPAPAPTPAPEAAASAEPTPDHEAGDQGRDDVPAAEEQVDDPKARAIERCRAERTRRPARFRARYGSGRRGLAACVLDRAER
jgi:hypothetical protein